MTTDATTVANDPSSVETSPTKLPPWTELWPTAPNPIGDPTKDTIWTMIRWGQEVLVGKCTSKDNFDSLAGATHALLINIEPPGSSSIPVGLQFDPLTVTVAEYEGYLPQLVEKWSQIHWNKKAKTPKTYKSRSMRLLGEYRRWCDDPAGYKCRLRRIPSDESKNGNGNGAATAKAPKKSRPQSAAAQPSVQPDPEQQEISFPAAPPAPEGLSVSVALDEGAKPWVVPVPDGLSVDDIRRLTLQLLLKIRREDLLPEVLSLFENAPE